MSPQPVAPIAADRFALRLALFYAATFALSGAYMPFFPVWLTAAGLGPGWIGLAGAVTTLARLTAVPVVTGMAERRHALQSVNIGQDIGIGRGPGSARGAQEGRAGLLDPEIVCVKCGQHGAEL